MHSLGHPTPERPERRATPCPLTNARGRGLGRTIAAAFATVAVATALAATTSHADSLPLTECRVGAGDYHLTADLNAQDDLACTSSLTLTNGARLDLRGFTLRADSILCGPCTISSSAPGAAVVGFVFGSKLTAEDVSLISTDGDSRSYLVDTRRGVRFRRVRTLGTVGVGGAVGLANARIVDSTLEGEVSAYKSLKVRGSTVSGGALRTHRIALLTGNRVRVEDTSIVGNEGGGMFGTYLTVRRTVVTGNTGPGVFGTIVNIDDSTVTGNGGSGVLVDSYRDERPRLRARDSIVTDNCSAGVPQCADVASSVAPKLHNTSCTTSSNLVDDDWDVCTAD